ncbi:MAG: cupin domain-containing protein [Acidimicrobiales bacterium]
MGDHAAGARPPFPGAVAVSHLRVYDTPAPDGLVGGSPHLHTACSEAYAVVAGTGAVQTLSGQGFAEVALEPGSFVWFTPGTVHRLVNHGGLEILVIMGNAGLPEAGDMVLTFPDEVLADAAVYAAAATLPEAEATTAGSGAAAQARRDLAVEGFGTLRAAVEADGVGALRTFHQRAAALVSPRIPTWQTVVDAGPRAALWRTTEHLGALADGDASHLLDSSVHRLEPPPAERRMGCCGTLGVYLP